MAYLELFMLSGIGASLPLLLLIKTAQQVRIAGEKPALNGKCLGIAGAELAGADAGVFSEHA